MSATTKGAVVGGAVGAVGGAAGNRLQAGGRGIVAKLAQKTGAGRAISNNEKMTSMIKGKIQAGAKIKEKTEFDFNQNRWIVPHFYLRNKEVILPKIKAAAELV